MAMCLQKTGNLDAIRDWILGLDDVFDRNNAGETEADNPGQALFLISLVSDKNHPLVPKILEALKRFEIKGDEGVYIKGRSDFADHPVYQTKWAKFGLRALGLPDSYAIPAIPDSYSSLFWMDYRDRHVAGTEAVDRGLYPYLGWATDHFQRVKRSPMSDRDYPLTWEIQASQADYRGMAAIDPLFASQKTAAPHTWHAAEIFLYLLDDPNLSTAPSPTLPKATFVNPIIPAGADPWVVLWKDNYYLCQSGGGKGVWVTRSARLQDLNGGDRQRVWTPPAGTDWSKEIWAPELHFLRGKWYIYVAADDGDNAHHRMYVLEGGADNPQAPFTFKGKIAAPQDRWAIDATILEMPGDKLYMVWSGWEGTENLAQHLYIAPMSDPWTISGARVRISSPELEWEMHGRPLINEGPEALWHGTNLFIIYSASGSWGDDYCLGQLAWTGGDVLDPKSWVKKAEPVFARTQDVFGPGHGSFVKSRDGAEDWIVYHSARKSGAGWNRQISIQKFDWNPDGSPHFGRPVPPGAPQPAPSDAR
jgi:GH43 family beta-xylosidase